MHHFGKAVASLHCCSGSGRPDVPCAEAVTAHNAAMEPLAVASLFQLSSTDLLLCQLRTARLMQLGNVETTTDIMNMRVAEYFGGPAAIAERTRQRLATLPQAGTNTVLVAHGNVLRKATEVYPQEAEAIVFRPSGNGRYAVVARLSLQAWARLVVVYGKREHDPHQRQPPFRKPT